MFLDEISQIYIAYTTHKIVYKFHNSISTAERKKNVSRRVDEVRRISARGWRTTYLDAPMKNDVSWRSYGQ